MSTTLKQLPESEVEISGTLSTEDYGTLRPYVLKELQKEVKIDGFRRGHIPEKILIERVGEAHILDECVEHALRGLYPELIAEHQLFPLGPPTISFGGEVVAGKPVHYKIVTAVLPTLSLPDYNKLAAGIVREPLRAVEEKDVDAVLAELQRLSALSHGQERVGGDVIAPVLPPLDDAFAQSFGAFSTLLELRNKMRENLELERAKEAKDEHRLKILEAIVAKTTTEIPQIIVQSELGIMFGELRASIERTGKGWDQYLTASKKTESDLRLEWRDPARKRALANLVLREIGKREKLEPTEDELTSEVIKILTNYDGADPDRTRQYVKESLFNDKVFAFLEKQSWN